jgi:hypothetical protein
MSLVTGAKPHAHALVLTSPLLNALLHGLGATHVL